MKKVYPNLRLSRMDAQSRKKIKDYIGVPQIWDMKAIEAKLSTFVDEYRKNIPENEKNHYSENYFDVGVKLLELAGFIQISSVKNAHEHGRASDLLSRSDQHQIWAHPSGVLVTADTCGFSQGVWRANSFDVYVQTDTGWGDLGIACSTSTTNSSSSYDLLKTGGHVGMFSYQPHSAYQLKDALDNIQKKGHIMPFHKWNLNGAGAYIGAHVWVDENDACHPKQIKQHLVAQGMDETTAQNQVLETINTHQWNNEYAAHIWERLHDTALQAEQVIPGLSTVLADSLYSHIGFFDYQSERKTEYQKALKELAVSKGWEKNEAHQVSGPLKSATNAYEWRQTELAVEEAQKTTSYTLQRYPSEQDKDTLEQWIIAIEQYAHNPSRSMFDDPIVFDDIAYNNINWNNIPYSTILDNTTRFPSLLVAQSVNNDKCVKMLIDLINHAPKDLVAMWCTQSDAAGHTLPMKIIQQVCSTHHSSRLSNRPLLCHLSHVLDALNNKCPASNWVMETQRSPYGDWLLQQSEKGGYISPLSFKEFGDLIKRFTDLGAPSIQNYSWMQPTRRHDKDHGVLVSSQQCSYTSLEDALEEFPFLKEDPHFVSQIIVEKLGSRMQGHAINKKSKM